MWKGWVVFIFGLWQIIAPWVLGFSATSNATWDSVVAGIIVAGLSLWYQLEGGKSGTTARG